MTSDQIGQKNALAIASKTLDAISNPDLLKVFQSTDELAYIDNTPFIRANINAHDVIINALDGKVIFNSAVSNYRIVLSQYIPEDDKFLFLSTEGQDFKCVLFDPKTGTDKWATVVGSTAIMLKDLLPSIGGGMKLETKDEVKATPKSIYATINNKLFSLDKESGKINWTVKEPVHRFHLSGDTKHIITMRNSGNILSSKRGVNALDTETGTPVLKDDINGHL